MDPVITEMDIPAANDPLRSGTDMFTTRRQDVFASLGDLEKKHTAFLDAATSSGRLYDAGLLKQDPGEDDEGERTSSQQERSRSNQKQSLSDTRHSDYRQRSSSASRRHARNSSERSPGRRSDHNSSNSNTLRSPHKPEFRRPQARPPHRRQPVPDFRKHPENYTHYSLGDVSARDMSERSNTNAALAFLEERRLQREREERLAAGLPEEEEKFDAGTAACSRGLITFSRRPQQGKVSNSGDHKLDKDYSSSDLKAAKYASDTTDTNPSVCEDAPPQMLDSSSELEGGDAGVCFKSRKKGKRNIRRKNDEDSD